MKNRTILVTGANRGIGLAIATGLAQNTNDTILIGVRDLEMGKKVAKEIKGNVQVVELDLASPTKLQKNIKEIKKVDVLINNAGVLTEENFLEISQEKLQEALNVNFLSVYELIRAFAPAMMENKYGRIINISSGWGSFNEGLTGPFSYSLTKAALNALTLTISKTLTKNVKINSMCPGWVKTRMGGQEAPRTPEKGAETAIWLANLPDDGPSGEFFRDKKNIVW